MTQVFVLLPCHYIKTLISSEVADFLLTQHGLSIFSETFSVKLRSGRRNEVGFCMDPHPQSDVSFFLLDLFAHQRFYVFETGIFFSTSPLSPQAWRVPCIIGNLVLTTASPTSRGVSLNPNSRPRTSSGMATQLYSYVRCRFFSGPFADVGHPGTGAPRLPLRCDAG